MQVRRPDDYDAKKVADLGPSEPSSSLNSLVLSQLKRPPPPPPEPVLPPAPAPAPALPSAAPQAFAPAASGEVEDGEVGGPVAVTRVLKLEHMVSVCGHVTGRTCLLMHVASCDCCRVLLVQFNIVCIAMADLSRPQLPAMQILLRCMCNSVVCFQ